MVKLVGVNSISFSISCGDCFLNKFCIFMLILFHYPSQRLFNTLLTLWNIDSCVVVEMLHVSQPMQVKSLSTYQTFTLFNCA
jgi:hypothetical protein